MRPWIFAVSLLTLVWLQPAPSAAESGNAESENKVVPVQIKRILLVNESPAVLLVDKLEAKFLLVFIDFFMANAIRMGMENPVIERPLTHDLIGIFLRQLGATVTKITITELKNNTYYALITLEVNGRSQEIDARPSDALAIAVRQKIPIFAAAGLLRIAGEREHGREPGAPASPGKGRPKAST